MADEREDEPKIRIVDRRMLTDDERAGKGVATTEAQPEAAPPKLEIVGGRAAREREEAEETEAHLAQEDELAGEEGAYEEPELTAEQEEEMRSAIEEEQFQMAEKQLGRPLTEQEKDRLREEMNKQAQAMASLEVGPMLGRFVVEMSQIAAVHMGLVANPYTRLIARNDTQARLAIDAFAAALQVLEPQLDAAGKREYNRVLNDLRVNFVNITGGKPTGAGSGLIIH